MKASAAATWRAALDGLTEEPFAPTARDWRWWLGAARRRPWLVVTGVGGFFVAQAVNAVLPSTGHFSAGRAAAHGLLLGAGVFAVRSVHVLTRHATESDDVRLERLARRRPVVAGAEPDRPVWSWQGPQARHSLRRAAGCTAVAAAVGLPLATDRWGWDAGGATRVGWVAVVLLLGVAPLAAAVLLPLRAARRARRLAAGPLTPVRLRLLGVGRGSQAWYAVRDERPDAARLVLPPFPGRSLLVAGDVVHVWLAADLPAARPPGDAPDVPVAVVGPGGTLWARLGYAPPAGTV